VFKLKSLVKQALYFLRIGQNNTKEKTQHIILKEISQVLIIAEREGGKHE